MSEFTYNATVTEGKRVRVSRVETGSTQIVFTVSPGATHAIMQGEQVSVFYARGGVMVYSLGGGLISFSGNCSPK